MKKTKQHYFIILLALVMIVGCSIHPTIKSEETYMKVKPLAPLSEYDQNKMPDNVVITIDNVADMESSYKNRLELYVNKYKIEPDEIYNYKSTYKYNLKLQPGQYKIEAKYYADSGWTEHSFTIKSREKVKVFPDKRTAVSISLDKNHWGGLKDKESYFKIQYEKFD